MAVTPYNIKAGVPVIANQNGVWGGVYTKSSVNGKSTSKNVVKQQYNKSAEIGTLTGKFASIIVTGKTYELVEVLLKNPVKPNWTTTYLRLYFQASQLDISNKAIAPPQKVVEKAKTKASSSPTTSATTNTDAETAYYDYVPESQTNWGGIAKIGGIILIVLGIGWSIKEYLNRKKAPKQ